MRKRPAKRGLMCDPLRCGDSESRGYQVISRHLYSKQQLSVKCEPAYEAAPQEQASSAHQGRGFCL